MKKLIVVCTLCLIGQMSYAQYALQKGQGQFNAGIGFSSWGVPVYAGFDVGVHRDISVGGEVSYRNYYDRPGNNRYHHRVFGISGNGNYHFNTLMHIPTNWDFYAGLNVGFYSWNSDDDYNGAHTSGLQLGAQVGGRYYFNNKFGLNLEAGGASAFSGGKFGITLKF